MHCIVFVSHQECVAQKPVFIFFARFKSLKNNVLPFMFQNIILTATSGASKRIPF